MVIYLLIVLLCCGQGGALQTDTTGLCGECPQCVGHTGFAPAQGGVCSRGLHGSGPRALCRGVCPKGHFPGLSCSGSRVLRKVTDSAGHASCALPASEQLRRPAVWRVPCPRWSPSQMGRATRFPAAPRERRLSAKRLLWGADLRLRPSRRMSPGQDPRKTWLAAGSLLTVRWRLLSLGPRSSSPLLSGSGCHTPAALPPVGREGAVPCGLTLLWYWRNPLSCEWAPLSVRAFAPKFSFFPRRPHSGGC